MKNLRSLFSSRLPRRRFLQNLLGGVGAATALPYLQGCSEGSKGRVVIVGGGFGGATCAAFLARAGVHVTLVEQSRRFVTCPFSNSVIAGFMDMAAITHGYDGLRKRGVWVVNYAATGVDTGSRQVVLSGGLRLPYDRLVLSPGIAMKWNAVEGYDRAASQTMPHAWKAGEQTLLLRNQLEAMEDGGIVVISAPAAPYRCPPAPYERACLMAHYLKHHKPRSKIIILDAKDSFTKQDLFTQGWEKLYPGMIDWVPASQGGTVTRVDPATRTFYCEAGAFKADAANMIPPQRAGEIARIAGVANDDKEWCLVDPKTFESTAVPGIHVLGDACYAGAMPKSGFAANSQGKACAAALVSLLAEREVAEPVFLNTCYSLLAPDYGISINAAYLADDQGIVSLLGSGGTSPLDAPSSVRRDEAKYAEGWYASMTGEMFGYPRL